MKKQFDPNIIIKINFFLLGLGITAYCIYALNTRGLTPGLRSVFGVPPVAQVTSDIKVNWCETRVTALIAPEEKLKIAQEGDQWILEGTARRAVDFISVEKWFGKYCGVTAQAVPAKLDAVGFVPALIVKFVTGEVEVLKRRSDGIFMWRGQAFSSPVLEAALTELPKFPNSDRK